MGVEPSTVAGASEEIGPAATRTEEGAETDSLRVTEFSVTEFRADAVVTT